MRKSMILKLVGMTFAAALAASAATAWAQDADEYGGYGPYGMGPGMMWGGGGYGPGMMGGYSTGPGMVWGYGAFNELNLSDEQRAKIEKIFDTERNQHWAIMGKMLEEQDKLRDLYNANEPDPKKVGAAYGQIAKLRQQMLETHVQASNQAQQVLTKEQREQWQQWRRGGWGWGRRGPGAGQQPGAPGPGMMR